MVIDELELMLKANNKQFMSALNQTQKSIKGLESQTKKSANKMSSMFKSAGVIAAIALVGKSIKSGIQDAMNAVENDNLFETTMGKWTDSTREWAEEMSSALGLNANEMQKTTGVIFNMTSSMGVAEKNALTMSKGITLLSNDMASFYNLPTEEAFNKLKAGLTGETEPLKALGIMVDENTVKQAAYTAGIAKNGSELTNQQKVLARYVAILNQTKNAQGDLARTLDSPANQMRIFSNNIKELSTAFGSFLLPILQTVMPYLNAFVKLITSALNALAKFLGFKGGGSNSAEKSTSEIASNVENVGSGISSANKEAKKLKGTLASFDEMNVIQDKQESSSSGGGGAGGGASAPIDFNLDEYDAHLEWINDEATKVAKNIEKVFKKTGDVISKIWNSEPMKAFVGATISTAQFLYDFIASLGISLASNMVNTWANVNTAVINGFAAMSSFIVLFFTDLQSFIETYGQPIIDGFVGIFNSIWVDAVEPIIILISQMWLDFSKMLLSVWSEYGKKLLDNIGKFVVNIIELFQMIWDSVIEPIIKPFLEQLSWLWSKHIKGVIDEVTRLVAKMINAALEIYNKFIHPIVSWLLDKIAPAFAFVSGYISGVMGTILGTISGVSKSIIGIFSGIIDFISGVFTGNWKKVWQGVSDIFKNIVNGLSEIFKMPINFIIDGINAFIEGLNKVQVPDWVPLVGGKGINIPKLQRMNDGGVLGGAFSSGDRQLYMGNSGEMVINRNDQKALFDFIKNGTRGQSDGTPIHVIVNIGNEKIVDEVIDGVNEKMYRNNEVVFDI